MAAWIFQANPNRYRILDAISDLEQDHWVVRAHRSRIRIGDRVYIWKSGERAGIYAAGSVLTLPRVVPLPDHELSYWTDAASVHPDQPRVIIAYERKMLDRPLLKADLDQRGLDRLPVVRAFTGSNFALTEEQAGLLDWLLRSVNATGWLPPKDVGRDAFAAVHRNVRVGIYRNPDTGRVSVRFQVGTRTPYPDRWVVPSRMIEYTGQGTAARGDQTWNRYNLALREAYELAACVSVFEVLRSTADSARYRYWGEWFVTNIVERRSAEERRSVIRFTLASTAEERPVSLPPIVDPEAGAVDVAEPPTRYFTVTCRILRDTELTRSMKHRYGYHCQVCGEQVRLSRGQFHAEAHHIRPLGGEHHGRDVQGNLIVLCPNHHAQFDFGAMAIDPATSHLATADPRDAYSGAELAIVRHAFDSSSLAYAWDKLFSIRP